MDTVSLAKRKLGVINIAGITIAGIFSLRTLPLMAQYGVTAITLYIIAALFYFIPSALICAELATGWPKTGGVYVWIREAFGERLGFLGIWLEWVNNVIALPSALTFMAVMLTYIVAPDLAQSKIYMMSMILVFLWGIVFINFLGIKISGTFSTVGLILGTLIPCTILVIAACTWIVKGHPSDVVFSWSALVPHLHLGNLAFLTGLTLGFAGMQVSAFHAQETINPQRDFPRAILITVIVILGISIAGSLAIAILLPHNQISLVSGIIDTAILFLNYFHLGFLIPVAAACLLLGSLASLNTWVIGPSKGLLATAEYGSLPTYFARRNRYGAPTTILIWQGIIGTVLALLYLFIKNVNSFFWLLIALSALMTLLMDMLLFASAIRLRYKKPAVHRAYRIPGGFFGIWAVAGIALITCAIAFCIAFLPPSSLNYAYRDFYTLFLVIGIIVFVILALLLAKTNRNK